MTTNANNLANKVTNLVNPPNNTGKLVVAPAPAGGQGLALTDDGQIPLLVRKHLPGYQIGQEGITAPVTVSSTTEASGTVVIAGASHPYDGQPVWIQVNLGAVSLPAVMGSFVIFSIFEGSTQIGRLGTVFNPGTGAMDVPFSQGFQLQPTVGYHTYSVTAFESGGSVTVSAGAGGTGVALPGTIRITKV